MYLLVPVRKTTRFPYCLLTLRASILALRTRTSLRWRRYFLLVGKSRRNLQRHQRLSRYPQVSDEKADLLELRAKFDIPARIELVTTEMDMAWVRCPGYYMFYTYIFHVDYTLSLLPLAEEFFRFYGVCQLSSLRISTSSLGCLLSLKISRVEITHRNLVVSFTPTFYRGKC